MTHQEMKEYLSSINQKIEDIPGHAAELWEDGEITLTKCNRGELYGARGLHMIDAGNPAQSLPLSIFPVQFNGLHACVRLTSVEEARRVRDTLSWPN